MKKRVLLIMGLCLLLLAGGCSRNSAGDAKKSTTSDTSKSSTNTNTSTSSTVAVVTGIPEREAYKASDYIKLGKYKGIEISVVKTEVTDADVENQIKTTLDSKKTYEKIKKDTVENGDTVNIDFQGIMNGKAFDGGSSAGFDLKVGSNQFIDGFEKGLIGKKVGDKVSLDLKFPKNYGQTDYAGKAVTFKVTINYIEKQVTPVLNDAFVKKNSENKTVAEYKESVRKTLEKTNESDMKNEKYNKAFSTVLEKSKISSVPKSLTDYYTKVMTYQLYSMAKSQGTDVDSYLKTNNMTAESFNQYVTSYVENYAKQDLVIDAIATAENITVKDSEIDKTAKAYLASNSNYKTIEDVYKLMPKSMIKQSVLSTKVMDFVVKNAKVTYTQPTPTPAATATPAASK